MAITPITTLTPDKKLMERRSAGTIQLAKQKPLHGGGLVGLLIRPFPLYHHIHPSATGCFLFKAKFFHGYAHFDGREGTFDEDVDMLNDIRGVHQLIRLVLQRQPVVGHYQLLFNVRHLERLYVARHGVNLRPVKPVSHAAAP